MCWSAIDGLHAPRLACGAASTPTSSQAPGTRFQETNQLPSIATGQPGPWYAAKTSENMRVGQGTSALGQHNFRPHYLPETGTARHFQFVLLALLCPASLQKHLREELEAHPPAAHVALEEDPSID